MNIDFLDKIVTIKDIPKESPFEPCLIENNEKQIGEICTFLQSDSKLLLVNGFKGTGKTSIINFVSTFLSDKTLVLKYNCFETTILDDMLLSFFETFRNYTLMGKIIPPRIKTENFTQKINSYFNTIHSPIVIILESFEEILKSNKSEILSFIKHLFKLANVKIIITTRKIEPEDFEDTEYEKTTCLALSKPIFEKFLKNNGIKHIGLLSNELYKHSKGYYNVINLSIKIMNLRQLNLVQFLEGYSKSFMAFSEFITREALSLVDPVSAHLFRLLTVMRIPIHVNLLKSLHLYNEERVFFFVTNSILSVDGECLYLDETFRDIIEHQIPENVMIKLHSACVDLYNTQLPLKPLERDLMLSRQTMRNEIEYHSLFIPKKPNLNMKDIRLITVDPMVETVQKSPAVEFKQEEPIQTTTTPSNTQIQEESKEDKINKISFIIDDESVLDNIADSIKGFIDDKTKQNEIEEKSDGMSLTQLLNLAKQEESKYNYKHAILLYQNALTKKEDESFYQFLPTIYIKLAEAHKHLSQWYEALEAYTQAQDFYFNVADTDKIAQVKLEIANIYYIMYKHDNAKYILSELEQQNLPNEMMIKVNLALAKLTDNSDIEFKYYEKALKLVDIHTNKQILAELYYKSAGSYDEQNDTRMAALYYKKCIELDSNPNNNKYLSMALANLAELYDEAGSPQHAIKYYNESLRIDKATKNYNGLYYSAMHLSEIYGTKNKEKALEYLNQALYYAKKLNETYHIISALTEMGDFYSKLKDFTHAYKYLIEAYNLSKQSFNRENLNKIQTRIEDIKHRISEQEFTKLQDEYGKQN